MCSEVENNCETDRSVYNSGDWTNLGTLDYTTVKTCRFAVRNAYLGGLERIMGNRQRYSAPRRTICVC